MDLTGARIPGAPVTVRLRMEFYGADKGGTPWPASKATDIEAAIEGRLANLRSSDGTPVTVDVIPRYRGAGDPPTPGFHQLRLDDVPPGNGQSNQINTSMAAPDGSIPGELNANDTAATYAHEAMHLIGFKDRYLGFQPFHLNGGKN